MCDRSHGFGITNAAIRPTYIYRAFLSTEHNIKQIVALALRHGTI